VDKGVTAEMSALEDILYMAKSVEEGNKVLRRCDERRRPGVSTSSHPVRAALPSRPSPTASQPVQGTRSTPAPTGPSKHRVPDCRATDRSSRPPDRKRFIQSSNSRPSNSFNSKPSVGKPNHSNKSKDTTCYSCGQVGHYSSDPQCPNFGQHQMGAIQEDHDHDAVVGQPVDSADKGDPGPEPIADEVAGASPEVELEPEPSDHGMDEYPLVGSQYTSEGEEYQLEMYEQYSDDGEQMMASGFTYFS